MLHGVANFYPRSAPDVRVSRSHVRRDFAVDDLCVPLIAYEIDAIRNGDHELRDGTEVDESGDPLSDETGLALWPTSTLVVSVLMRCRGILGSTDVLELGSGSGFCGLVARQIARRVVFSDRELETRELIRRNLRLQPRSDVPASLVEPFGWAEGDARPAERFGLVVASDVIYGAHQACCCLWQAKWHQGAHAIKLQTMWLKSSRSCPLAPPILWVSRAACGQHKQ